LSVLVSTNIMNAPKIMASIQFSNLFDILSNELKCPIKHGIYQFF
jgi:hypothetical protein